MLFTFDTKRIKFNRICVHQYIMFGILPILLIISLSYLIGYKLGLDTSIRLMDTEEKMFIIQSIVWRYLFLLFMKTQQEKVVS